MLPSLSIFLSASIWSAQWWTAVGAVATVLALFAKSSKKRNTSLSSETRTVDSNVRASTSNIISGHSLAASGNNITQNVVLHQQGFEGQTSAQKIRETRRPSRPSCHEILEDLNRQSPYNRPQVAKNYEGLFFSSWATFINTWKYSSDDPDEDRYVVSLIVVPETSDGDSVSIFRPLLRAILSLRSNPLLRIAKSGDVCWIEGHIDKIEYDCLYLRNGASLTWERMM